MGLWIQSTTTIGGDMWRSKSEMNEAEEMDIRLETGRRRLVSAGKEIAALRAEVSRICQIADSLREAGQVALSALYNVPEVGGIYDQQHSETQLIAATALGDALDKSRGEDPERGSA